MQTQPLYKLEIAESGLTQKQWYSKIYLKSEHWKLLRQSKFSECGKHCEICGKTTTIEVHHLRYREIYDVLTSDLQVLCKKHHSEQHKRKKPQKRKKKRLLILSEEERKKKKAANKIRKAMKRAKKQKKIDSHNERLADFQDMRFNMITFSDESLISISKGTNLRLVGIAKCILNGRKCNVRPMLH